MGPGLFHHFASGLIGPISQIQSVKFIWPVCLYLLRETNALDMKEQTGAWAFRKVLVCTLGEMPNMQSHQGKIEIFEFLKNSFSMA